MTGYVRATGIKKLQTAFNKIERAVRTGKADLARSFGLRALSIARTKAPTGVRSPNKALRNAIIFKTNRIGEGYESRVWVRTTNRNNLIAIANEFGVKPRTYYIGEGTKNEQLREWVMSKARRYPDKQKYLRVGGSNTRLGKRNKFWKPTFDEINTKQFNSIVEQSYSRRIEKAIK